jgi:hypothetical protein
VAKSARSKERFFTFAEVTAEFFNCGVPTLFFGTLSTVAYPVPPRARPSATHAITSAGDGRRSGIVLIVYLPCSV